MSDKDWEARIEQIITSVVDNAGCDLVDVKMASRGKGLRIAVLADHKEGGITVDECAALNKSIVFKIEEAVPEATFTLEVSSPGIDWPLSTQRDFLRTLNRKVRFFLNEAIEEKMEYAGLIEQVVDDRVIIACEQRQLTIPINKIRKAVQII